MISVYGREIYVNHVYDVYERHVYEIVYGRCTLMRWLFMGCIPCEMHVYERHAYGQIYI